MNAFNMASEHHELELLSKDYNGKITEEDIEETGSIDSIKVIEIIPDDDYVLNFTVTKFRDKLTSFTDAELEKFINYDKRKTIINEATKELKKRK